MPARAAVGVMVLRATSRVGDKDAVHTVPHYDLPPDLHMVWSLISRPLRASFGISRGAKNYALSLRVELRTPDHVGFGESVPYARYGERLEVVRGHMRELQVRLSKGESMQAILDTLAGGCVREAIDAARWDLLCKSKGQRIHDLLDLHGPASIRTCYTVSLDHPVAMAKQAGQLSDFGTLKLKLGGGEEDIDRIAAVRKARPDARLIADANEAWAPEHWEVMATRAKDAGLSLIEQPFAQGQDEVLAKGLRPLPCFADESVHGIDSLEDLVGRYDGVNIKLGKCGGLDRGLAMLRRAKALGFKVMVGCMVGSSRSIAPALVLAVLADEVDLDAHLWLAQDLNPGLRMRRDAILTDFAPGLWG